jgi:hypothetical protein
MGAHLDLDGLLHAVARHEARPIACAHRLAKNELRGEYMCKRVCVFVCGLAQLTGAHEQDVHVCICVSVFVCLFVVWLNLPAPMSRMCMYVYM